MVNFINFYFFAHISLLATFFVLRLNIQSLHFIHYLFFLFILMWLFVPFFPILSILLFHWCVYQQISICFYFLYLKFYLLVWLVMNLFGHVHIWVFSLRFWRPIKDIPCFWISHFLLTFFNHFLIILFFILFLLEVVFLNW